MSACCRKNMCGECVHTSVNKLSCGVCESPAFASRMVPCTESELERAHAFGVQAYVSRMMKDLMFITKIPFSNEDIFSMTQYIMNNQLDLKCEKTLIKALQTLKR